MNDKTVAFGLYPGLTGLLRVRLTFFMPGASGRKGCSDAQEGPSRVQA
jgi:hypothetical protein